MANFNLNDYETVADRIKRFYKDHEDGRIITSIALDDGKRAVMKAALYVGETKVSTGYAEEIRGEGFVNKTSHLENAETSAIGRALANFNYAGDLRASREEMEKVNRMQVQEEQNRMQTSPIAVRGFYATLKSRGVYEKEKAERILGLVDKGWKKLNTSGIARVQKELEALSPDTIELLLESEEV